MANDMNQCTFTGRLGADPEIRDAGSSRVANLRLAVGETWKSKDGERKEATEWIAVTVWGDGLVGIVESYLKKGSKLLVQGKWKTRKWQDKDGNDRYSTECVLQGFDSKLQMLDGKPSEGGEARGGGGASSGGSGGRGAPSKAAPSYADDLDDSVPF